MKYSVIVLALLLSSCACKEVVRPPVIVTETVEVPVPVKCNITWPEKPNKYLSDKVDSDSVLIKGNAVIAENKEYELYTKALEIAVKECLNKVP